jgi:hypothetical protein
LSNAQCGANPGNGLVTIAAANQLINSYYPGTGNPLMGQSSLTVGTLDSRGSTTALAVGDLVLIVQMQGAELNTANSDSYGNGIAGGPASGALSTNLYAGYYEYNTITGISGSTITFTYTLANSYYTQAFTSSTSLRNYQVIRVPRYYDLTIDPGASVTAPAWNGSTGGVVVLDAVNTITLNGSVNVTGLGFRGGGGKQFTGAGLNNTSLLFGILGLLNTDYRFTSAMTTAPNMTGGAKGEGIAGTPAYTYSNGAVTSLTGSMEGYIDGATGRGAPANAGGGGTDGIPVGSNNNQYNTGGGGGGNAGAGGTGGSGWHGGSGSSSTFPFGGFGGSPFTAQSIQRLIMGGGGGAGTANNSDASNEYQSSGGAGGGIIISRAKLYAGNGSLVADGGAAPGVTGITTSNTDAAGGGGAGGTIVVVTRQTGAAGLNLISASAAGGAGGIMVNYYDHGPGGGGGGGVIYTNGTLASTSVAGGINGKTRAGSTSGPITNDFGATPGSAGQVVSISGVPLLINNNNIASPCGVLPVTITSLKGVVQSNGVLLLWDISGAINLRNFEVEYSTDGTNFSYVSTTAFDARTQSYQYLHQLNPPPIVYYRLKMVNINGSFSYSKVITLKTSRAGQSLLLYPNPAKDVATVQVKMTVPSEAGIMIIDASQRMQLQKNVLLQKGDNVIELDVNTLPAGIYIIEIKTKEGTTWREKLRVMSR